MDIIYVSTLTKIRERLGERSLTPKETCGVDWSIVEIDKSFSSSLRWISSSNDLGIVLSKK